MSHQSGIQPGPELAELLPKLQDDSGCRMIQVLIEDEAMTVGALCNAEDDDRGDWNSTIFSSTDEKKCCFILYRLDSKNSNGYDFVFISYSPDFAHVREKMLFASTRATLMTFFGKDYIKWEMFGTVPDDISLDGFDKHVMSEEAPVPLTIEEHEKAEIRSLESGADIGASTKKALVSTGVDFPLSDEAIGALKKLESADISFVSLVLDIESEKINLDTAGESSIEDAAKGLPEDMARYLVYNFTHNHEGDELDSIVFIYYCPSFKMKVKARMLYAAGKQPVVDFIESEAIGLVLDKKAEIDEASDFTHDYLYNLIHPPKTVQKAKFARPKGPSGRKGTARMTGRSSRTSTPRTSKTD